MISLVMSIYNGEAFIIEQLDSIKAQEKQPDEVLIFDDCSTDNSYKIVKSYINSNNLITWKIKKNPKNLGWKKSFQNALEVAEGDIIFLSDQDDIWKTNKISEMVAVLNNRKDINLLACSYEPFYDDEATKRVSKKILRTMKDTARVIKIPQNGKFMTVLRPGCTFCVRKELVKSLKDIWNENIPHDAALWRSSIIEGTAYLYDKRLINWRRYSSSNSNPLRAKNDFKNIAILEKENMQKNVIIPDIEYLERYLYAHTDAKLVKKQLSVFRKRNEFYNNSSLANFFKLCFVNIFAGLQWSIIVHDLLIMRNYKKNIKQAR